MLIPAVGLCKAQSLWRFRMWGQVLQMGNNISILEKKIARKEWLCEIPRFSKFSITRELGHGSFQSLFSSFQKKKQLILKLQAGKKGFMYWLITKKMAICWLHESFQFWEKTLVFHVPLLPQQLFYWVLDTNQCFTGKTTEFSLLPPIESSISQTIHDNNIEWLVQSNQRGISGGLQHNQIPN